MNPIHGRFEKRIEPRIISDDVIRFKRPGRFEDHKAWTIDRSPSGYGFITRTDHAPSLGDTIHIRRFDTDRWDAYAHSFHVARIDPVTPELVIVGCVAQGDA